jgi:hypothetical protein
VRVLLTEKILNDSCCSIEAGLTAGSGERYLVWYLEKLTYVNLCTINKKIFAYDFFVLSKYSASLYRGIRGVGMMIEVLLSGGSEHELVPDYLLGELLARNRVKGFRRSGGWVVVGRDPIRKLRNDYYPGPERRRRRKGSCLTCPDMVGGKCINSSCPEYLCNAKACTCI